MGEIRTVGPGKTCGNPYLVCKTIFYLSGMYITDYLTGFSLALSKQESPGHFFLKSRMPLCKFVKFS